MKVRMVETTIRELDVHVADSVESIVDVFQIAQAKYAAGEGIEVADSKRNLGQTVVSIAAEDEKGTILMVQRMGQIVITDDGGPLFRETKESHAATKLRQAEEEALAKQADEAKPAGERTN